jgi:hypothetical protein
MVDQFELYLGEAANASLPASAVVSLLDPGNDREA